MKLLYSILLLLGISTATIGQVSDVKLVCNYDESSDRYTVSMHVISGSATNTVFNIQAASQISLVIPVGATLQMVESYNPSHSNGTASNWSGFNIFAGSDDVPMKIVGMTPTISPVAMYDGLAEGDIVDLFSFSLSEGEGCRKGTRLFENGIDPSATELNGGEFSNSITIGTLNPLYSGNIYQSLDRDGGNICAGSEYQLSAIADVVYQSSDPSIATVSSSGLLETYAEGRVLVELLSASQGCVIGELFYQVLPESDAACLASSTKFESNALSIYPSPASDWLTIADGATLTNVSLRTASGQACSNVRQQKVGDDLQLEVSHLPIGIYFLTSGSEHGYNTQRIIVAQ